MIDSYDVMSQRNNFAKLAPECPISPQKITSKNFIVSRHKKRKTNNSKYTQRKKIDQRNPESDE